MGKDFDTDNMGLLAGGILEKLRSEHPLIDHITNFVVMNITANITIAAGARPIMGHALEEAAELTSISRALVINAGNATFCDWNEAMIRCGLVAEGIRIPVVLDPVGYGAGPTRTRMIDRILAESHIDIIRGNIGEIGLMSGSGGNMSGVDAVGIQPDARISGKALALASGKIVAVGGKTDFVTDGKRSFEIASGHELLTEVTGGGCMATSMIAAWGAVSDDLLLAAVGGLAHYRMAAELAAGNCSGPGSFMPALMDAVHSITPRDMAGRFPVREV